MKPLTDMNEINTRLKGSKALHSFCKEIKDKRNKAHKYTMTWYELASKELMVHAKSNTGDEYILVENAVEGYKLALNMAIRQENVHVE